MKRFSVRTLAAGGVLIALNVVLSRLVSIPIGNAFRISLGSVPIILSGLWLGPLAGGICGAAGDLMGCLVAGYAPNPFITASTVLMGVIPGLFREYLTRGTNRLVLYLRMILVLALTMLVTSQGLTTLGLSVMYGMEFWPTFFMRLPQSALLLLVNASVVSMLQRRVPASVLPELSRRSAV